MKDSGKLDKMTENKGASRNSFKDKEKPIEVRLSNIIAAKGTPKIITVCYMRLPSLTCSCYYPLVAVGDAIRTSLGPKGMDKMVSLRGLPFCI